MAEGRPRRDAAKRSLLGMAQAIGGSAIATAKEKINRAEAKKFWNKDNVHMIAVAMEKVSVSLF